MTKFVRVTAENGYHVTLEESYAKAEGLKVLKEDPCDVHGRPKAEAPGKAVAAQSAQESADADTNTSGSDDAASTQEETQE